MIRIRELRKKRKMTQSDLADLIGVSKSSIGMYETGEREPNNETLKKLANYFSVSTDYLLENTSDPNPYGTAEIHMANNNAAANTDKDALSIIKDGLGLPHTNNNLIVFLSDGGVHEALEVSNDEIKTIKTMWNALINEKKK